MDIGSIFLILALLLLVGLYITRPFFDNRREPTHVAADIEDHDISSLLAERDRILNALQELDFDHTLGKIPAEDYPAQRATMLQRGADVLRRLDAYQPESSAADVEARMEAAIAARSADGARKPALESVGGNGKAAPAAALDDDIETLLANRRRERKDKASGFCPKCGGPVLASDRFCPKCGLTQS